MFDIHCRDRATRALAPIATRGDLWRGELRPVGVTKALSGVGRPRALRGLAMPRRWIRAPKDGLIAGAGVDGRTRLASRSGDATV